MYDELILSYLSLISISTESDCACVDIAVFRFSFRSGIKCLSTMAAVSGWLLMLLLIHFRHSQRSRAFENSLPLVKLSNRLFCSSGAHWLQWCDIDFSFCAKDDIVAERLFGLS